jgi:hypothetical protein
VSTVDLKVAWLLGDFGSGIYVVKSDGESGFRRPQWAALDRTVVWLFISIILPLMKKSSRYQILPMPSNGLE